MSMVMETPLAVPRGRVGGCYPLSLDSASCLMVNTGASAAASPTEID
jgi:hypothetical protein